MEGINVKLRIAVSLGISLTCVCLVYFTAVPYYALAAVRLSLALFNHYVK